MDLGDVEMLDSVRYRRYLEGRNEIDTGDVYRVESLMLDAGVI